MLNGANPKEGISNGQACIDDPVDGDARLVAAGTDVRGTSDQGSGGTLQDVVGAEMKAADLQFSIFGSNQTAKTLGVLKRV